MVGSVASTHTILVMVGRHQGGLSLWCFGYVYVPNLTFCKRKIRRFAQELNPRPQHHSKERPRFSISPYSYVVLLTKIKLLNACNTRGSSVNFSWSTPTYLTPPRRAFGLWADSDGQRGGKRKLRPNRIRLCPRVAGRTGVAAAAARSGRAMAYLMYFACIWRRAGHIL